MDPLLELKHISVEFDGFKAVDDVNASIDDKTIHFFIGPNGAGKTTLLDVICGKTRAASGEADYRGVGDLLKMREFEIVKHGVCRKFQVPSIFANLSVYDNMRISVNRNKSVFGAIFGHNQYRDSLKIMETLHLVGLEKKKQDIARSLSHGQKQWLEIAMLLVQEPKLLLLDEPVAGMGKPETEKTGEILAAIKDRCAVAVVEHDMDFVKNFADVVTVMHEGKVLTEGSAEEVMKNETVRDVYLGRGEKDGDGK